MVLPLSFPIAKAKERHYAQVQEGSRKQARVPFNTAEGECGMKGTQPPTSPVFGVRSVPLVFISAMTWYWHLPRCADVRPLQLQFGESKEGHRLSPFSATCPVVCTKTIQSTMQTPNPQIAPTHIPNAFGLVSTYMINTQPRSPPPSSNPQWTSRLQVSDHSKMC